MNLKFMLHYIQIFGDVQLTIYVFVIQMKELRQRVCTSTPRLNIRSTLSLHPQAHSHQAMLSSLLIIENHNLQATARATTSLIPALGTGTRILAQASFATGVMGEIGRVLDGTGEKREESVI